MKLYYNSATEAAPIIIDGEPPVDQSAALAAALARIGVLEAFAQRSIARDQARKDADAVKVDGQDGLDDAATLGL